MGNENFQEETDNFLVNASAAKYVADIAFYNGKTLFEHEEISNPCVRRILFSGGINIYRKGQIPGTKIKGSDIVVNGKLWTARDCSDDFLNGNGLRNIIFGGEVLEKDKERVIENIVLGFKTQKKNESNAKFKREHNEYMRGAMDHHEKTYGTFGRVPFSMG